MICTQVGAGPTGPSEPWLEAGDDGVLRPCSQYHPRCGPNPLLRDWAKKFDDRQQLARGGYPAYDPIVRLRDALDSRVDDTEAVVLCLGSLENVERLLDLDEDVFARRGGARVAAVRALDEPGDRAKRVLSAASSGLVARRGACAAALGPSLEDASARDPFLCADSQAALALAQAQLAAGRAFGGDVALRGFLESSIYAFVACPPPGAAPEVALDVREAAVDVVDGALEDVDNERRGLLYVDVVEGWADAADASLVRDVVVKTVADGPWCPQGAHKAKEHKRQHRPRPRSEGPRRVPGEDEGANAAAADYGAVVITHRHGYARPGPRAAMSTRQVPGGGGGTTKPPRPASPLLGTRRRVTAPAFHK